MPNMSDAIDGNLKASSAVSGAGYIMTNDSTNNRLYLHPGGDVVPLGISAGASEKDVDGVLLTTADASVSIFPLSGILYVRAAAEQTWTTGLGVYCGAGGLALDGADASGQQLGIYLGTGINSVNKANGEVRIPVLCSGVGHI